MVDTEDLLNSVEQKNSNSINLAFSPASHNPQTLPLLLEDATLKTLRETYL